MNKLIIFAIVLILTSGISFAADSLQTQCNNLITAAKGTALENLANNVCNTALGIKPQPVKPTNSTNQAPTTKKAKRNIGAVPNRSDTAITKEQIKSILSTSIIKGNEKARFIIIEYSDLQCPFCQRHRDNKTIETVVAKYKGKVASTFRHFPLGFHENAAVGAYAAQCVIEQDKTMFYDFIGGVFGRGLNNEQDLYKTVEDLKLDVTKLKACMKTTAIQTMVEHQMTEGINLFGISGTPGNIILDTVTGKYKGIMGAYPASEFEKILDVIVK